MMSILNQAQSYGGEVYPIAVPKTANFEYRHQDDAEPLKVRPICRRGNWSYV